MPDELIDKHNELLVLIDKAENASAFNAMPAAKAAAKKSAEVVALLVKEIVAIKSQLGASNE
ncbi:hypothetical protein [Shewanella fidelis]|uniref:Uncharacterized protein n=1 Tax=Shewanella fidelis TaxID=173509 RepID=A0AAW8NMV4_9GAMM|nr:hypothetical protein [Shewanella fidelis]MDR8523851.1 hypothetical protein [Shewanella fidelis]MDW4810399.1 hypothetical protein [Shewanella fidelis]MDW4823714.1 hypothetical protein [Shewanella fidelis]